MVWNHCFVIVGSSEITGAVYLTNTTSKIKKCISCPPHVFSLHYKAVMLPRVSL